MKRLGIVMAVTVAMSLLCADIASACLLARLRARRASRCCVPVSCGVPVCGPADTAPTPDPQPGDDEPIPIDDEAPTPLDDEAPTPLDDAEPEPLPDDASDLDPESDVPPPPLEDDEDDEDDESTS